MSFFVGLWDKVIDIFADSLHGKAKFSEIMNNLVAGQTLRDIEVQIVRKDQKVVWVNLSIQYVRDMQGTVSEKQVALMNISPCLSSH